MSFPVTLSRNVKGACVLAANAMGECPRALFWLYLATVAVLLATTAHYVYLASSRADQGS